MNDTHIPSQANREMPPPVVTIPLGQLVPDAAYQPRGLSESLGYGFEGVRNWQDGLDPDQLESLRASQQEKWPPLLVTPSASSPGSYDLLDGFHRYAVAQERATAEDPIGWLERPIACYIIEHGGVDTAIAANIRHGLPLSLADRKAAARLLHRQNLELSYRQIAAKVGLSDKTVKAALVRDFSAEFTQIGDGPTSSVKRTADPIQKLVKLAAAASNERTGTNWIAKLFSKKTDQQQQVDYVAYVIKEYREEDQAQIAQRIAVMGQVLIAGAKRFLGETDQQGSEEQEEP